MEWYWHFLGLKPGSSKKEILAAYRRLAKRLHPDHGGTDADFQRLNEAFHNATAAHRQAAVPTAAEEPNKARTQLAPRQPIPTGPDPDWTIEVNPRDRVYGYWSPTKWRKEGPRLARARRIGRITLQVVRVLCVAFIALMAAAALAVNLRTPDLVHQPLGTTAGRPAP
jgi:DnaJ domain